MTYQPIKLLHHFLLHLFHPFLGNRNQYNLKQLPVLYLINFLLWIFLIPLKLLEIIGFSHLIHFLFKLSTNSRQLNDFEIQELKTVFKDSVNYQKIRINETSKWAKIGAKTSKNKHLGFAFINTINFTRSLHCNTNLEDMQWLVHEMTHISQYNKLGLQYIFEALIAQHFGGYNFGGFKNTAHKKLNYFNLEQQAEIIKYCYELKKQNKEDSVSAHLLNDLLLLNF